jgi:ketosteroid isomerase-like protein
VTESLPAYIDAWTRHDIAGVLATLTEDCVVVESYGPVYRGTARVEQWMRAWFEAGGVVTGWDVTSHGMAGGLAVAEWTFACIWKGANAQFDGATVARLDGGRIRYLREYATTASLYDWTGTWPEA